MNIFKKIQVRDQKGIDLVMRLLKNKKQISYNLISDDHDEYWTYIINRHTESQDSAILARVSINMIYLFYETVAKFQTRGQT
jgi:hypothetical protein